MPMLRPASKPGIDQNANAEGGDATVTLDNTNSININAVANGTGNDVVGSGGSSWSGYNDVAGAQASIGVGIDQAANADPIILSGAVTRTTNTWGSPGWTNTYTYATSNATFAGGDASVTLTNDGTINVAASANADATGQALPRLMSTPASTNMPMRAPKSSARAARPKWLAAAMLRRR